MWAWLKNLFQRHPRGWSDADGDTAVTVFYFPVRETDYARTVCEVQQMKLADFAARKPEFITTSV